MTIQYGWYIQHYENEHYGINVWVEYILKQAYDSVLLYKAQNEEPSDEVNNLIKEDILLHIQTQFQKDMMVRFGNNIVLYTIQQCIIFVHNNYCDR